MVRRGFNTKFGERKFDVEIDEGDLLRMLADFGADSPAGTAAAMKPQHAFKAMDEEALAYCCFAQMGMSSDRAEQDGLARQAREHRQARDAIFRQYLPQP